MRRDVNQVMEKTCPKGELSGQREQQRRLKAARAGAGGGQERGRGAAEDLSRLGLLIRGFILGVTKATRGAKAVE